MGKKYKHLIPQNVAPKGATQIVVYNTEGKIVGYIPLGFLRHPVAEKRYSVLLTSDVHITYETATDDFQRAMQFFDNSDCQFVIIAGDLSKNGTREELETFMSYVGNREVHFITGNHENFETKSHSYYEEVTGRPLYYSFEHDNDVYIMVGHYGGYKGDGIGWVKGEQFSDEELQWLYETLEINRNKRCFVFTHMFPWGGAGNANGVYTMNCWTSTRGTVFENLMKHYKNVTLFHGHSHLKYELQELDEKANYSSADGYRSVHISSLVVPRDVVNDSGYTDVYAESEAYIMDVYDDYIILNGRDFIDNDKDGHIIPIATYKIDTTLVNIEANTFIDSTGTITT